MNTDLLYPYGTCQCGCGQKTNIAKYDNRQRGHIKGQPRRFVLGHRSYTEKGPRYIVDEQTGCWKWQWAQNARGYGVFHRPYGCSTAAHIFYYTQKYGVVPAGKELDHICRNRSCVNPDHLQAVTHKDNTWRSSNCKINFEIAERIRQLHATGEWTYKQLGIEFCITPEAVSHAVRNLTWMED